ncbi:hypothetical protein [Geitlerinema sp. PCC 9228]|nr:hypothetical protein [Geitlerinema sp. PCC 9228]
MMDSTSPVRVDFTQQDAIVKILPRSFLLASYEAAWDNLHILYTISEKT